MVEVKLERPRVKYFTVFHVSQMKLENGEEIPPYEPEIDPDWKPHERAEAILNGSGAVIIHDQRDRACYSSQKDEIHLPPKSSFPDEGAYYPTALHELGHWTRHRCRLDRANGPFGSPMYAREELRVEIASWMLSQDIGLAFEPERHADYVGSWIQALEDEPFEIVRACRDAEKIKKYILGLEQGLSKDQDQTKSDPFVFVGQDGSPIPMDGAVKEAVNFSQPNDPNKSRDSTQTVVNDETQMPKFSDQTVILNVPYIEKNKAKSLGAKWDAKAKLWKAPPGTDLSKLEKWISKETEIPEPKPNLSPEDELRKVIEEAGLVIEEPLQLDGKVHQLFVNSGTPDSKEGAYCGFNSEVPSGWVVNHKTGFNTQWVANGHTLSDELLQELKIEIEARKELMAQDRERSYSNAAYNAYHRYHLTAVVPTPIEHPHLQAKDVFNYGLPHDKQGNLMVPGYNLSEEFYPGVFYPDFPISSIYHMRSKWNIQTLQIISSDGKKKYEPGTKIEGAGFLIGESLFKKICYDQSINAHSPLPLFDDVDKKGGILFAKDYTTGATLHRATGLPVVVAFESENLQSVAEAVRKQLPNVQITICADNDHCDKFNLGVTEAKRAAKAVDGQVMTPDFTEFYRRRKTARIDKF